MTIGMLLNAPYPDDVRVKKETGALLAAGFKVCLLCTRRLDEKKEELINGLQIKRVDAGKSNMSLALYDILMSLTFIHPVFKKAIPGWVKKNSIDILHVHDLPLAGTALEVKRKLNIPVVVDFHENYPDALRTWFIWKKNPLTKLKNRIFMNPKRWARHEKQAALESDHVIAVVDEMKVRLIKDYSLPNEKVRVISNTEERTFLDQPLYHDIYKKFEKKFIITYTGNIGPHRGVDTVIEGMHFLRDYPEIVFVIVGSGSSAVMKMLKKLVEKNKVESNVFFLGRQPFEKFYSYMHLADVNIIPHKSNAHTNNTVPHKLFQSMMSGRPVLVSSSDPLKRFVDATGSGLVFEANNPRDFAKKILRLYQDRNLCIVMGMNGKKATVDGMLNWDNEQLHLINFYKGILGHEKHPPLASL